MPSIILSFVGNQDPVSHNTNEEGSIVTLIRHLLSQKKRIKKIILLHTIDTEKGAKETKEWLIELLENSPFTSEQFFLLPVDNRLSEDPINLSLVIEEIKKINTNLPTIQNNNDILEFNSSSGTPAMKSAFAVLQAAGYFPKSNIWQVRNPKAMKEGQNRVFQANVDTLKREFDLNIIQTQINNYNYNGAIETLRLSSLTDNQISSLLEYGSSRLASNFEDAQAQIENSQSFEKD